MNVTDATAKTAMLRAVMTRTKTTADKHRETRARRAELRSLRSGVEVNVGYFKMGVQQGRNLIAQCHVHTHHRGVGTDDASGEPLKGKMVLAAGSSSWSSARRCVFTRA